MFSEDLNGDMMQDDRSFEQYLIGEVEPFDDTKSLSSYLEEHLLSSCNEPNLYKTAAIHGDNSLSYHTLNTRANLMARNLSKIINNCHSFSATEFRVGVLIKEGFHRLISILACLKLGVSVVPLSLESSMAMFQEIVNKTRLTLIIKDEFVGEGILCNDNVHEVLVTSLLQDSDQTIHANLSQFEEIFPYHSQNNAFILFTSGSSGTAKEVMLTHRQIFNRLFWQWKHLPYSSGEVVCHRTGFMFVDNIIECLSCLLSGVTMVIVSPRDACNLSYLSNVIHKHKVTWLLCVPSIFQRWIKEINGDPSIVELLDSLRTVVSSGEILSLSLAKMLMSIFNQNHCSLVNLYGSTEVAGDVTCQVFHNEGEIEKSSLKGSLSVGYPISNNIISIKSLTDNEHEVLVKGVNVSPSCSPVFHTGDSGFISEGRLYVSGRVDDMAKINGRKIFTKDIDSIVMTHGDVLQCYTVHVVISDRSFLVTYFTVKESVDDLDRIKLELTRQIVDVRSDDCVPRLEHVEKIPLQSQSLKPDKRLLRSWGENVIGSSVLPQEPIPLRDKDGFILDQHFVVKGVLAKHLGINYESLLDTMDFYELGGDSLTTVTCVSDLSSKGFLCSTEVFIRGIGLRHGTTIGIIVNNIIRNAQTIRTNDIVQNVVENFKIDEIKCDQKEEILSFLVDHFYSRELVGKYLEMSEDYFIEIANDMFGDSMNGGCSFLIRDKFSDKLLALQLSSKATGNYFDKETLVSSENILETFLQYCKLGDVYGLNEPRLNILIVALSSTLPQSLTIKLLYFVERYSIQIAQTKGYKAVETVNTSEVTRKICSENGYRLIRSSSLSQFMKNYAPEVQISPIHPDVLGHYMVINI